MTYDPALVREAIGHDLALSVHIAAHYKRSVAQCTDAEIATFLMLREANGAPVLVDGRAVDWRSFWAMGEAGQ